MLLQGAEQQHKKRKYNNLKLRNQHPCIHLKKKKKNGQKSVVQLHTLR